MTMLIKRKRGFELPEAAATPEHIFKDRRRLLAGLSLSGAILAAPAVFGLAGNHYGTRSSAAVRPNTTGASFYPARRNDAFMLDRPLTEERYATTYNNFYEFGSHKSIAAAAQVLEVQPWAVRIDGLVEKEITLDVEDLFRRLPHEERLYRHRCVEAWSMAVPWSGFPMKALVDLAKPLAAAKFVRMETFQKPEVAAGQLQSWYPWPYVEGLTMGEATNELAFLATGLYGKPLAKQNGAPLRLVAPWKYGFKSIKSIVRLTFSATRPVSFWESIQPSEYGFWANVNPEVPHRRWSQASETVLGTNRRVPTQLFNGYGEFVAHLYPDRTDRRWFM
jgi:sulfoxide reductase catalytic subunit YedY